jgi:hypothetical protein
MPLSLCAVGHLSLERWLLVWVCFCKEWKLEAAIVLFFILLTVLNIQ